MEFRKMVMITLYVKQKKRHRCTKQTFGLCGRRWGRDVSKEQHVYYLGWNRSPVQVGCMRQVLGPGALGRPREIRWRGRWEGGSGWGIHVTPWLIHVNVWQNPLKCCEVISLQLIKINEKKRNNGFIIGIGSHTSVGRIEKVKSERGKQSLSSLPITGTADKTFREMRENKRLWL